MTTATPNRPATCADIEALPEHLVGEILFGALVTHPRPNRRHGKVLSVRTEKCGKDKKRRLYETDRLAHLSHIDPGPKTLEVFRLQDENWLLTNTFVDAEVAPAPPSDAFTFALGLLRPFDPPSSETPSDEPA